jgi:uracil-DNA glycosylase
MDFYWNERGFPWEHDPGPPKNRRWARLFAETPNYRALGKAALGSEKFRWHFGPMFYRGRLWDNSVKVLVIGQEGAQDESLARRAFTGGTGARMQYLLNYLGITQSYLFLNTFVYPIYGQYDASMRWLAQHPDSPVVQHRHKIFNYVLERNNIQLVIAVGNAARDSVITWIQSRGGTCPSGGGNLSNCDSHVLSPVTRTIHVMHPGGAGQGGSVSAIIENFRAAVSQIKLWIESDPTWLPPDPDGSRDLAQPYKYRSAPIPFRDFPYGFPLRLGRGGTSSNRRDQQRSIQIFSASGVYNAAGVPITYSYTAEGDPEGYAEDPADLPYEPPKLKYLEYDRSLSASLARLFMGGRNGFAWPDFTALGASAHPSFGWGPIFRGRPTGASVLILADQQSHDDLFTGRALTGDSGQRMQAFLEALGIRSKYIIVRVLPVDTLDDETDTVRAMVEHSQTQKVYRAILSTVKAMNSQMRLMLTFGPFARLLAEDLHLPGWQWLHLKAWKEPGALADWQAKLEEIQQLDYPKEIAAPAFTYTGQRGQIPRLDLPYGNPRWIGTSGDRASKAFDTSAGQASPDYYKLYLPLWVHKLALRPLSSTEQAAIDSQ